MTARVAAARAGIQAEMRRDDFPDELAIPADPALVTRVLRLAVLMDAVLDEIAGSVGLSGADYLIVGVLYRSPEHRNSPTRIAEILGRTTGGLTAALDRLERRRLLRRLPDPTDRRRVVLEATKKGIAVAEKVNAALIEWEANLGLDDEARAELSRSASKLTVLLAARAAERS